MTKDQLRVLYKQKRAAIPAAERAKLQDLMLIQFQKLDIEIPSMVMTYAVFEQMNEFDPEPITDYCYFKNPVQTLLYPVVSPDSKGMLISGSKKLKPIFIASSLHSFKKRS